MTDVRSAAEQDAQALDVTLSVDEDQRLEALRRRMHTPVGGLLVSMGFLIRERSQPRAIIGSGDVTGVHILNRQPPPRPGSFHLGGAGLYPFEARIRILAETLERYAGHAAAAAGRPPVRLATWQQLAAEGQACLTPDDLTLFSTDQFRRPGFPFAPFAPDAQIGWVRLPSLPGGPATHVPAQWFLLGYVPQAGEPWMGTAVTTGTAAHTDPGRALLSAVEELVQLDATMGHWYGATESIRIRHDARTRVLQRMIERQLRFEGPQPEFHLLPSADLPGFTVACLLRRPPGQVPRIAVGQGSGGDLVQAMYRGLLEAVAVQWLAAWVAIEERTGATQAVSDHLARGLFDLEGNIALAAGDEGGEAVEQRFARCSEVAAGDLPPDHCGDVRDAVRRVVAAFRDTGKRLYHANLTTPDVQSLGFTVIRVWSPDTLSLTLPGAPEARHRRFGAYGGFVDAGPHPYP
ncbi:MAG TPA: YcaO-like family protein [Kineosporiaceae bacterium]